MPHCFGVPFVLGHVETMQNTRTHYARPKFIGLFMSFLKRVLKNGKSQGTGIERAFQQAMQLDAKLGKHGLRKQESTKCAEFWLRFVGPSKSLGVFLGAFSNIFYLRFCTCKKSLTEDSNRRPGALSAIVKNTLDLYANP